jgi:rubrerythrin
MTDGGGMRPNLSMTTPLPPAIGSSRELLALAGALEQEAARRYRELAERMRLRQERELAALFAFLAGLEDRHARQISEWSSAAATDGAMPPPTHVGREIPENFAEEAARSATLTPYVALAIAVRNEERAFAFYCHAAAGAQADIQAIAEELARDELHHASLLRHARRAAFRREGRHTGRRPDTTALPQTLAVFRAHADDWRSVAAGHHHALADALDRDGQPSVAAAFRQVAFEESAGMPAEPASLPGSAPADIRDGLRRIEEMFDRFDDIAALTNDAAILGEAQLRAEDCVRWLALTGGAWRNGLHDRDPAAAGGTQA